MTNVIDFEARVKGSRVGLKEAHKQDKQDKQDNLFKLASADSEFKILKFSTLVTLRDHLYYEGTDPLLLKFVQGLIISSLQSGDEFCYVPLTLCDYYVTEVVHSIPQLYEKVNERWLSLIENS